MMYDERDNNQKTSQTRIGWPDGMLSKGLPGSPSSKEDTKGSTSKVTFKNFHVKFMGQPSVFLTSYQDLIKI